MKQEAIQYLPIDAIVCESQIRKTFAERAMTGLARSMQEVGLQQPIRVRRNGERYVVVDGERRLRAARLIGWKTIAVIVEEKELCTGEVVHRQLISLFQRTDCTASERARGIKQLLDETGWPASEAAAKCGLSSASVTRTLAILDLPEAIQRRIDAGEIPESAGYLLKQVDDPEKRSALVAQMAEGKLTRDDLASEVKGEREEKPRKQTKGLNRATALLASGDSVTAVGTDLTIDRMIEAVAAVLAKLRALRKNGVDLVTACRTIRQEAKAEANRVAV
jgi:ParB family chromosome partitioning protein